MTVYFAEEIGTGRIKIGYTQGDDPQRDRIDGAMTMSSHEVEVRAVLPGADEAVEKELHEAFAASRVTRRDGRGTEFFHPGPALWSLIGYVADMKALPSDPVKCATLRWSPDGYMPVSVSNNTESDDRLPGVTYRGSRIDKTSANVLTILRMHSAWSDAIAKELLGKRPVCLRDNGVLLAEQWLDNDTALALIVNWFVTQYSVQVPKTWIKDAINIICRERSWGSPDFWKRYLFDACRFGIDGNTPDGTAVFNLAGARQNGLADYLETSTSVAAVLDADEKYGLRVRLKQDIEAERSLAYGSRLSKPNYLSGHRPYDEESRLRSRIANFRNWELSDDFAVYPTVDHVVDFLVSFTKSHPGPQEAESLTDTYSEWCLDKGYCPLRRADFKKRAGVWYKNQSVQEAS